MSCVKTLSIAEAPSGSYRILYWTMEETALADRVDSVVGLHLVPLSNYTALTPTYSATALGMSGVSALHGNGCKIAKGPSNTYTFASSRSTLAGFPGSDNVLMRQDGNGYSLCFWLKVNTLNTVQGNIQYYRINYLLNTLTWTNSSCKSRVRDTGGIHYEEIALPIPTAGVWTFYELYHDAVTDKMGVVIDNTTDYPASFTASMAASPSALFGFGQNSAFGAFYSTGDATDAQDYIVDEVLIRMDARLTVAQRAYLYNAGAGRTWPIVLP